LRSKETLCILANRMAELKYRGRIITDAHLLYIRELIGAHPQASRRTLSKKLCEAWQWRQANGALSDMVCRSLLLMLERAGQIKLPPVNYVRHNPLAKRARPMPRLIAFAFAAKKTPQHNTHKSEPWSSSGDDTAAARVPLSHIPTQSLKDPADRLHRRQNRRDDLPAASHLGSAVKENSDREDTVDRSWPCGKFACTACAYQDTRVVRKRILGQTPRRYQEVQAVGTNTS
jgi:hypothetical protein